MSLILNEQKQVRLFFYADKQYDVLGKICSALIDHHPSIKDKKEDIVGHNDIALKRKSDPWNMDWDRLRLSVGTK